MTTVINTPQPADDSSNSMGMIIGFVALILIGYLFFVYGLPAIKQVQTGTQINVPSTIDVNVKQTE